MRREGCEIFQEPAAQDGRDRSVTTKAAILGVVFGCEGILEKERKKKAEREREIEKRPRPSATVPLFSFFLSLLPAFLKDTFFMGTDKF